MINKIGKRKTDLLASKSAHLATRQAESVIKGAKQLHAEAGMTNIL